MSQPTNDDALDRAIESAMRQRPAPAPPAGLADLAVARAAVLDQASDSTARWLRVRRWTQWANAAAAAVLAAWLLFAVFRLPDRTTEDTATAEPSQMELAADLTVPTAEEAALAAGLALVTIITCWVLGRSLTGSQSAGGLRFAFGRALQ